LKKESEKLINGDGTAPTTPNTRRTMKPPGTSTTGRKRKSQADGSNHDSTLSASKRVKKQQAVNEAAFDDEMDEEKVKSEDGGEENGSTGDARPVSFELIDLEKEYKFNVEVEGHMAEEA
jgi:hypothetical protein